MRSFFFFKQKTAYEMRISDWSSDVCSSDLSRGPGMIGNACLDTPPLAALGMNGWGECGWHERLTRSSRVRGQKARVSRDLSDHPFSRFTPVDHLFSRFSLSARPFSRFTPSALPPSPFTTRARKRSRLNSSH